MLPSRGLLRSSPSLGLARVRAIPSTSRSSLFFSTRQFGTALRTNYATRLAAPRSSLNSARIGGALALGASCQQPLFSRAQARFASTQPAAVDPVATSQPEIAGADLLNSSDISTPVSLTGSDLLNMPEQLGFLKAYGLDYGWGVTAMMEWYVEHIYIYTGLPWWATISLAAIGLRLAIFKPSLDALSQTQILNNLRKNSRYSELEAEYKSAITTGGGLSAGLPMQQEMGLMRKKAGVKLWKTMLPMINIPISFGMFRLFRGMAGLPVPSLEDGGILWFTDLSVADPFFILPVVTAFIVWRGLQVAIPYMAPAQQKTMKLLGYVLMPLSVIFTVKLSAATQLYFLWTALLHTLQSSLFYQTWFRKLFGLGRMPKPLTGPTGAAAPVDYATGWQAPRVIETKARRVNQASSKSYFSGITESISSAKKSVTSTLAERSAKSENKSVREKAKEYEERRALEEKEKLIARREYRQMRKRQK